MALIRVRMSMRAREIMRPRQRRLTGERIEEHLRAVGERRAIRQFQGRAPIGRHWLLHVDDLKRRSPPPCRGQRPMVCGDSAPPCEFMHGAFELHICGLMHRLLQTMDDTRFCNGVQCEVQKMSQRSGSAAVGRTQSQPAMPASIAQSAVTSITLRKARSNAAMAAWGTPSCPANTAFNVSLA